MPASVAGSLGAEELRHARWAVIARGEAGSQCKVCIVTGILIGRGADLPAPHPETDDLFTLQPSHWAAGDC